MNHFKYISHSKLNKVKWDKCISNSFNERIYAYSWYLDIISENWNAIIYKNYKAVFPVIFKNRILFKTYYQPFFAQQLGLFINREINDTEKLKLTSSFFTFLYKKIGVLTFCSTSEFKFYFENVVLKKKFLPFSNFHNVKMRINLELDLTNNYSAIIKNYKKNTVRNLDKAKKKNFNLIKTLNLKFEKNMIQDFLFLYQKNVASHINLKRNHLKIINDILVSSFKKEKGYFISVFFEGKLISSAFILSCYKRDILIFHATEESFREFHPTSYLIDSHIRENSNSDKVLDFEGSSIDGIYRFYKGFGAIENNYYLHY